MSYTFVTLDLLIELYTSYEKPFFVYAVNMSSNLSWSQKVLLPQILQLNRQVSHKVSFPTQEHKNDVSVDNFSIKSFIKAFQNLATRN